MVAKWRNHMEHPLTGNEEFILHSKNAGITVMDFWRWAFSDLINNTQRGIMAEFLVYSSLNQVTQSSIMQIRENWLPFDIMSPSGRRIEVKSAAFIQAWTPENILEKSWLGITLPPLLPLSQSATVICMCSVYLPPRQRMSPCSTWTIGIFMCCLHPFWTKRYRSRRELACPLSLNWIR